jgi:acyl dehydratase
MAVRVFRSPDDVASAVGEELGHSDWLEITQERIDAFADATGDHQWIHVDPQRAARGPFGRTVAHGYLTLSLVPFLAGQIFAFDAPGARLNYGTNKVRFPSPVPVGARIRAHAAVERVTDLPQGQQLVIRYTVEIEGHDKPGCVADAVVLLLSP